MIKLQNIVFPSTENCTEEALFFRRHGETKYSYALDQIVMQEESLIGFDTYFNSFSASKWYKYTKIQNVGVCIRLCGKFRVSLVYKEKLASQFLARVVGETYVDTKGIPENFFFTYETTYSQGMFAFELMSLEDEGIFLGGYYFTKDENYDIRPIRLGIAICTYKREKYIYKNLDILKRYFLDDRNSELYENLEIVVSDNAQTLDDKFSHKHIHIYKNKNVGGSGGFTRGIIECMNLSAVNPLSHILLMDDDVLIHPEAIFRTYKLLTLIKEQYEDSFVGGAMLRMDQQWFQTESGGSWNKGNLVSHKCGLDLRSLDACLYNEFEEKCDFNAWWFCTIPMCTIRENNLPLPIFIRGDDVEYGLRNMKHLILMNGICVWHEPFEYKYSSSMFYYIFRNRLIDNATNHKFYSEKELLADFKEQFFRELFTLRYKNAQLLLDGVNDFLKGVDFLKATDGEALNKKIMEQGYRLSELDELQFPFSYPDYERTLQFWESKRQQTKRKLTLNGIFFKAKNTVIAPVIAPHIAYFYRVGVALNYDSVSHKGFETCRDMKQIRSLFKQYCALKRNVKKNYSKIVTEYADRKAEITNLAFWKSYLEI